MKKWHLLNGRGQSSNFCCSHNTQTSQITLHSKATQAATSTPSFPPFYPNGAEPASTPKKKPSPRVLPVGNKHTDLCPFHTANRAPPSILRACAALCVCSAHRDAKELLLTKADVFKSHKMCKRNIYTERLLFYYFQSLGGESNHYSKLLTLENHLFQKSKLVFGWCKTNLPLYAPFLL